MDTASNDPNILEQRKFLHDIANPLAVSLLIVEMMAEKNPDPKFEKLKKSLDQIKTLIEQRRKILIEAGTKPSS